MSYHPPLAELNIAIVHRRIKHHAQHSGYSAIFEYMNLAYADKGFRSKIAAKMPASLRWRLHLLRPQPVGDDGLMPELLALSTTASKDQGICHFIYGEDTYFYTPLWQHKDKKVIATYHYPPVRLNERVNRAILKHLSAVILMSQSQRSWFEQYLPAEKIHVVHHHVNTEFFHPASEETTAGHKFRIVSLGGILRDMPLLLNVVEQLTSRLGADNIQFNFLIPKNAREPFKKFSNVNLCGRITDEELRSLYHNATLGFMPLIDCTANNAVLEMMACGKAIVCSKAGGIGDYLDKRGALMFDQAIAAEQLVTEIIELLNNPQTREQMGSYNRQRALDEFSLEKTANKLLAVYQQVADQG